MRNRIRDDRRLSFRRAFAVSQDGGETFSETRFAPELATPACEGSVLRLPSRGGEGRGAIIFSSPASPFRSGMTIWASRDEAKTWNREILVDPSPAAYSDLTVLPGGAAILYENGATWAYRKISFRTIAFD
jgi:sialidase-1